MNKERLSRLITQYQKNLEFYRNAREFNEQDCRDEFISPLLESFGWDVHNEKGTSPQDPMYAYDENNMLIASGGTAGYCAISKLPDSKYDLRYIQAWLNHPYTEKLFQIMGSDFEGGFTARGTYLLKKIPFVELDFNDKIQKALYESVLVSVKRIRELNNVLEQKKDKASVGVIEAEKENLSKRIEDDITKIYNLQF